MEIWRLTVDNPGSILHKSITGRYRPVRVADGPIMARFRFIKNASWVKAYTVTTKDDKYQPGYMTSNINVYHLTATSSPSLKGFTLLGKHFFPFREHPILKGR